MDEIDNECPQPQPQPQPQGQIARVLVEFLQVSITCILFHKSLYPSGAFERRRYMNLVVHKAKHPQLQHYIHSAVNGLFPFIQKGFVDRVALLFYNPDNTLLEKYHFKLQLNQSYQFPLDESQLGLSLRSFLLNLSSSKHLARALPTDCRWEITAFFRADARFSTINDLGQWVPTDTKQWQQPSLITPIKSLTSEPLGLQLYIEHPNLSERQS